MDFQADLRTLEGMLSYIRSEAISHGLEEKVIQKIELACEEAIVNIISYAYKDKAGPLSIMCTMRGHRFEITLSDQGIPFNPIDVEINPQFGKPVQERRVGGLGIYLIRKTIDEASYQRIGDKNVLRLCFV